MKAISKILLCMCIATAANAQYFSSEYGSTLGVDDLKDGTAAVVTQPGHLITGTTSVLGGTDLTLVRTNVVGGVPTSSPFFRRIYKLTTPAGTVLTGDPAKVIELPNGRIAVFGTCTATTPSTLNVFTAVFQSNGTPINIRGYSLTGATTLQAISACKGVASATDATIYATGQVGTDFFIIAFNGSTNALIWNKTYNITGLTGVIPADIIASPFNNNVVVVGNVGFGTSAGAFFMRVNRSTGAIIGSAQTYDYSLSEEIVSSITTAKSNSGGAPGYMICGTSDGGLGSASRQMWVFKVDVTGASVLLNKIIPVTTCGGLPSPVAPFVNSSSDIVERLNTSGAFEYYASGTGNNTAGFTNMLVFKLDDLLNPATGSNQFALGNPGTNRTSIELAIHGTGTGSTDGLGVYGSVTSLTTGTIEMQIIKSYFNGYTGCNFLACTTLTTSSAATLIQSTNTIISPGSLTSPTLNIALSSQVSVFPICNLASVAGGSNARLAEEEQAINSPTQLWPNPVSAGASDLQINLNLPTEEQVQFRIVDINGRIVVNQTLTVSEGNSTQTIGLPSDLSAGMYMIQINGTTIHEVKRFVVE